METLPTLRKCLIDTELARMRVIARLWGADAQATRPLELAAELAQYMSDPGNAADTWENLSEDERAAFNGLLGAGGPMPSAAFQRRYGEIRPVGPGRLEREAPWRDPVSAAEGLWYRGLIYAGFSGEGQDTYPIYFIPAELRKAVPVQAEGSTLALRLEPVAVPAHRYTGGELLLEDVTTILAFIHNETVRPSAGDSTAWQARTQQELLRFLRDPNPERLDFILHLIDHLGWTRTSGDGRLRLKPEPVMAWLQESTGESLVRLIRGWRELETWTELWSLTPLEPIDTGTWRDDARVARAALLDFLEAPQASEWFAIVGFIEAIRETDPDFLRPGGDYEQWYVRDTTTGAHLSGFESWDQVEGVLLRALLTGPAFWLGLVELGEDVAGAGPTAFRKRPKGHIPSESKTLVPVIHPDLTISMPGEQRLERFQLSRIADLVSTADQYAFRLTPTSLRRARQERIDLDKALSFLAGLGDAPLPKAVSASLKRWADQGTEVWLEKTVLLRVSEESVMQQITSSSKTGPYIIKMLNPSVAIVAEKDWLALIAGLAELGFVADLDDFADS
jgi:hypothetical protein